MHEIDYQENVSNVNMCIIDVPTLRAFMQMHNIINNRKSLFPMMTVMVMHLPMTGIQTPFTLPVELKYVRIILI